MRCRSREISAILFRIAVHDSARITSVFAASVLRSKLHMPGLVTLVLSWLDRASIQRMWIASLPVRRGRRALVQPVQKRRSVQLRITHFFKLDP